MDLATHPVHHHLETQKNIKIATKNKKKYVARLGGSNKKVDQFRGWPIQNQALIYYLVLSEKKRLNSVLKQLQQKQKAKLNKKKIAKKRTSLATSKMRREMIKEKVASSLKIREVNASNFKKEVIKDAKLKPTGYKILLEILVLGNYNKAVEVGFEFGKRSAGVSKLGFGIIFSYISHLIRLLCVSGKLKKFRETIFN